MDCDSDSNRGRLSVVYDLDNLRTNSVATPLLATAYKLHRQLFYFLYSFPFICKIANGVIRFKTETVFKLKYIPLIIAEVLITVIIGFGSCVFLLLLKLLHVKSRTIDVIAIFVCIFLGSCALLEWGTYLAFGQGTEVVPLLNQLFCIERHCKSSTSLWM